LPNVTCRCIGVPSILIAFGTSGTIIAIVVVAARETIAVPVVNVCCAELSGVAYWTPDGLVGRNGLAEDTRAL
jgi:hypothetical protein